MQLDHGCEVVTGWIRSKRSNGEGTKPKSRRSTHENWPEKGSKKGVKNWLKVRQRLRRHLCPKNNPPQIE
ncbi:hypothetical protein RRG08_056573 [Elysia crispata]|uniref:Uncharacterized protein n=1 Tax=Elysia crispata TaxID=231223 RepID=A0AAE1E146_9GAST|nr:hypothetical protein RRG08_056573 [Elysia crispata]